MFRFKPGDAVTVRKDDGEDGCEVTEIILVEKIEAGQWVGMWIDDNGEEETGTFSETDFVIPLEGRARVSKVKVGDDW